MASYEHYNHETFKMRYHIIFSTKYRRKLFKLTLKIKVRTASYPTLKGWNLYAVLL